MRVYSEEVELDSRDPEQDYLQYKESCESLATLMGEIQDLKANGAKEGVRILYLRYTLSLFDSNKHTLYIQVEVLLTLIHHNIV